MEDPHPYLDRTPGDWLYQDPEPGFMGNLEEPPEEPYPPTIISDSPRGIIELAQLVDPVPEDPALDPESGDPIYYGSYEQNGKLMAAAPNLLDALDDMVSMFEVSEIDPRFSLTQQAKILLKDLKRRE